MHLTDQYAFDDDTRPFGESPLKSFFNRIFSVQVSAVSPVPADVLSSFGLPYGQYVTGSIAAADRALVGEVGSGRFSLDGPFTGPPVPPTGIFPANSFPVEAEESYDPGTGLFKWIVGVPSSVTIPLTGGPFTEYYLAYDPPVAEDCCWCKSHVVRLLLEPTPAFLASGTYTGAQVSAAIQRLVERIKEEQLPIHARLGEVVLAQSIALQWPSVTINVGVATTPPTGQLIFNNTRPGNPWFAVIGL